MELHERTIKLLDRVIFTPDLIIAPEAEEALGKVEIQLSEDDTNEYEKYDNTSIILNSPLFSLELHNIYFTFYNPYGGYTLREIAQCCFAAWTAPLTEEDIESLPFEDLDETEETTLSDVYPTSGLYGLVYNEVGYFFPDGLYS